jgi:hypothetical protein
MYDKSNKSKVNVCVVIYEWWMWGGEGWKWNRVPTLDYSYRKGGRKVSCVHPINKWLSSIIHVSSQRRDLRFNPRISGTQTSHLGSAPPYLLDLVPGKQFLPFRDRNRPLGSRQCLCAAPDKGFDSPCVQFPCWGFPHLNG